MFLSIVNYKIYLLYRIYLYKSNMTIYIFNEGVYNDRYAFFIYSN